MIRLETLIEPKCLNLSFSSFVLLLKLLKLDKQFPVEQFEATVSQSTVPSPTLTGAAEGRGRRVQEGLLRLRRQLPRQVQPGGSSPSPRLRARVSASGITYSTVSSHTYNSHNFKWRVSDPRSIVYFHFEMPCGSSILPGAGLIFPDRTFVEIWHVQRLGLGVSPTVLDAGALSCGAQGIGSARARVRISG